MSDQQPTGYVSREEHERVLAQLAAAEARAKAAEEERWPERLTETLRDILGRPCFMFIDLARLYRDAGLEIPTRAEDEQAFFLHRLLSFWFQHKDGWRDAAQSEVKELRAAILAKHERKEGA